MSKTNNLKDFLTDVANAIRAKKGSTDLINPQDFSSEIASLPSGLEIVDMTETTATIDPNKVYIWGMVESLNITIGASTDESDFFAFRFRCSKPTMTSVTVNGATWADDTELDAQGKPVLDPGSWYQCEIKGGTSALYARLAHYIPFEDLNVEAVLLAKGVGDGLGITYKDAAKVTSISTWFKGNADITSFAEFVNFSGITKLLTNAFNGCTSLAEVSLPASLTSIGENAFNGCTKLTSAGINLSNIKTFSKKCFWNTSLDGELALPSAEGNIGYLAFANTAISTISDLGKITSISKYINWFDGGYGAFRNCINLKSVILPDTLTTIGEEAFSSCSKLESINFVNAIETIGTRAFLNCTNLKIDKLSLPNLKTLGNSAFVSCHNLFNIEDLGSITTIPANNGTNSTKCFAGCSNLKKVKIPQTVTTLGTSDSPFWNCMHIEQVIIYAKTPPSCGSNTIFSTVSLKAIYVPDGCVTAYQEATVWANYASYIKPLSEFVES